MNETQWKPIKSYKGKIIGGKYEVSNTGLIRNSKMEIIKFYVGRYAMVNLWWRGKSKSFFAHRIIAEAFVENPQGLSEVDHIDRDKLNNDLKNLRWVSHSQNMINRIYPQNTSKYRGVSKNRTGWCVYLSINKKQKNMGYFSDELEAAKFYNEVAEKHYGEFALLNKI